MTDIVKSRSYTAAETDRCLLDLVICGGNSLLAARRLKEAGVEIASRTLREWRQTRHRERYLEIARVHAPMIDRLITQQAREGAIRAAEVEQRAWEAQMEQLDEGQVRDPSAVARNAAVSKAVNVDKMLLLEGRPTQITEHRDVDEIIRALDAVAPGIVVHGTASETE